MPSILLVLLSLLLLAPEALASDGLIELNQTCAVETGCVAGDTPGYPITIPPGSGLSFRLTSDLTAIPADTDGIFLNTAKVTIDFNGFSMIGFVLGTGTGNGIVGGGTGGAFAGFTTIRNGTIRGFRERGIDLRDAQSVSVQDMVFDFNGGGGLLLGPGARVIDSRFYRNGGQSGAGVDVGTGSLVSGNVLVESGSPGIRTDTGCTIERNTVTNSDGGGIEADIGATVRANTSHANGGHGIRAELGSTVSGNTTYDNALAGIFALSGSTVSGNTSYANDITGIATGSDCLVLDNTLRFNASFGLDLSFGSSTTYRGNVISSSAGGATILGSGVDAGGNVCDGVLGCP